MLDGYPLVDVHLHAVRLPSLKPAWKVWAQDFGDSSTLDAVYDASGTVVPERFDAYLYARHNWTRLTRRMIFGTDWPGVPGIARNARAVAAQCPDEATAALVLAGNACRVYNLKVA
jgi:predicted TIM-barrel fold metal-dependent hydrolase